MYILLLLLVRCRVCAVSSGGQGAWSNEALFQTPPTLPRPPSEVRVSGKVTQGSAVITWGEFMRPTSKPEEMGHQEMDVVIRALARDD